MVYPDQFAPGFAGLIVGGAIAIGLIAFVVTQRTWLIPLIVRKIYHIGNIVEDSADDIQDTAEQEERKVK